MQTVHHLPYACTILPVACKKALHMNSDSDFGTLLDEYLAQGERSGRWLAARLGVNASTVTRWRNGQTRPNGPEMAIRVADILSIHGNERARLLKVLGYSIEEKHTEPDAHESKALDVEPPPQIQPPTSVVWLDHPATYRQTEMAMLAQWLDIGASGIVMGLAGSGVSTLLRYFVHRPDIVSTYRAARQRVFLPIWIELQPMPEAVPSTLYRLFMRGMLEAAVRVPDILPPELLQTIQTQLHETDSFALQTALYAVFTHCQATQVGLVFVLDRADLLAGDVQAALSNTLRAIRDQFRDTIIYLLGMRITPTYLETLYALGALGRLLSTHALTVGSLVEQDSRFVIASRTKSSGVMPTESEIQRFLALSGGYPTLLKAVIRWWLTKTPRPPQAGWVGELTAEPNIQLRLREIWRCLSVQEQAALLALTGGAASQQETAGRRVEIADQLGDRLVQMGILQQQGQGWKLRGQLFAGCHSFSIGSQ